MLNLNEENPILDTKAHDYLAKLEEKYNKVKDLSLEEKLSVLKKLLKKTKSFINSSLEELNYRSSVKSINIVNEIHKRLSRLKKNETNTFESDILKFFVIALNTGVKFEDIDQFYLEKYESLKDCDIQIEFNDYTKFKCINDIFYKINTVFTYIEDEEDMCDCLDEFFDFYKDIGTESIVSKALMDKLTSENFIDDLHRSKFYANSALKLFYEDVVNNPHLYNPSDVEDFLRVFVMDQNENVVCNIFNSKNPDMFTNECLPLMIESYYTRIFGGPDVVVSKAFTTTLFNDCKKKLDDSVNKANIANLLYQKLYIFKKSLYGYHMQSIFERGDDSFEKIIVEVSNDPSYNFMLSKILTSKELYEIFNKDAINYNNEAVQFLFFEFLQHQDINELSKNNQFVVNFNHLIVNCRYYGKSIGAITANSLQSLRSRLNDSIAKRDSALCLQNSSNSIDLYLFYWAEYVFDNQLYKFAKKLNIDYVKINRSFDKVDQVVTGDLIDKLLKSDENKIALKGLLSINDENIDNFAKKLSYSFNKKFHFYCTIVCLGKYLLSQKKVMSNLEFLKGVSIIDKMLSCGSDSVINYCKNEEFSDCFEKLFIEFELTRNNCHGDEVGNFNYNIDKINQFNLERFFITPKYSNDVKNKLSNLDLSNISKKDFDEIYNSKFIKDVLSEQESMCVFKNLLNMSNDSFESFSLVLKLRVWDDKFGDYGRPDQNNVFNKYEFYSFTLLFSEMMTKNITTVSNEQIICNIGKFNILINQFPNWFKDFPGDAILTSINNIVVQLLRNKEVLASNEFSEFKRNIESFIHFRNPESTSVSKEELDGIINGDNSTAIHYRAEKKKSIVANLEKKYLSNMDEDKINIAAQEILQYINNEFKVFLTKEYGKQDSIPCDLSDNIEFSKAVLGKTQLEMVEEYVSVTAESFKYYCRMSLPLQCKIVSMWLAALDSKSLVENELDVTSDLNEISNRIKMQICMSFFNAAFAYPSAGLNKRFAYSCPQGVVDRMLDVLDGRHLDIEILRKIPRPDFSSSVDEIEDAIKRGVKVKLTQSILQDNSGRLLDKLSNLLVTSFKTDNSSDITLDKVVQDKDLQESLVLETFNEVVSTESMFLNSSLAYINLFENAEYFSIKDAYVKGLLGLFKSNSIDALYKDISKVSKDSNEEEYLVNMISEEKNIKHDLILCKKSLSKLMLKDSLELSKEKDELLEMEKSLLFKYRENKSRISKHFGEFLFKGLHGIAKTYDLNNRAISAVFSKVDVNIAVLIDEVRSSGLLDNLLHSKIESDVDVFVRQNTRHDLLQIDNEVLNYLINADRDSNVELDKAAGKLLKDMGVIKSMDNYTVGYVLENINVIANGNLLSVLNKINEELSSKVLKIKV